MSSLGLRARLARRGRLLPILLAELVIWLGFGALLPVLPLYITANGVDLAMLGAVVAAWPAARLVGEPAFGWLADRMARRPLMVGGLVGAAIFSTLPLWFVGAGPFIVLRALAGLCTAAYDPAVRGYLVETSAAEERGEVFGLYGSAQMGGLLLGPAVGAIGAAAFGGFGFVFVFTGVALAVSAIVLLVGVRDPATLRERSGDVPATAPIRVAAGASDAQPALVGGLRNRLLLAAVVLNVGTFFAGGTYDVIWSLYVRRLGGSLELIGLTFALFGLPVLVLSPIAGRLVDRRGGIVFLIVGSAMPAIAGLAYTVPRDPVLMLPIIVFEGIGFALQGPALYTLVGMGSPPGGSSTAQGVFGAAGTIGFIVSSLVAGRIFEADPHLPFVVFAATMFGCLALSLLALGRRWAPIVSRPANARRRDFAAAAPAGLEGGSSAVTTGEYSGLASGLGRASQPVAMRLAAGGASPGGAPTVDDIGESVDRLGGGASRMANGSDD